MLGKHETPLSRPLLDPPQKPAEAKNVIYGFGLVEAQRRTSRSARRFRARFEVYVDGRPGYNPPHKKVGDRVMRGEPLFRIDDRDLTAELNVRESSLRAAVAQLHRLDNMPRAEDLPPAIAAVDEAQAKLNDAEAAYNRDLNLYTKKMLAASDFDKDRYTLQRRRATLAKTQADLAKLKAGAWKEDIDVQRAAVDQAKSQVENIKIMLDRLIVRAPVEGEILQVNIRPGQFAALAWKEPMIVLGEVNRLHVRVDIDENDLYRFQEGVAAWANIKGRREPRFALEFVRVEPYVIPKKSLTGDNTERVDTGPFRSSTPFPCRRPPRSTWDSKWKSSWKRVSTNRLRPSREAPVPPPHPQTRRPPAHDRKPQGQRWKSGKSLNHRDHGDHGEKKTECVKMRDGNLLIRTVGSLFIQRQTTLNPNELGLDAWLTPLSVLSVISVRRP